MASTASRLDIYNMALGFVGTGTIASPNENRPEAIQCELYWDRARRAALRDFPYNFAKRRVFLAEKPFPAEYEGDWRCCYALPEKCLRVLGVHLPHDHKRGPFIEVHGDEHSVIMTDVANAVADYIYDVEDISRWDDLFVMSMARRLACLIATPLLKNNQAKLQELEQLYQMSIPKTDGIDAAETIEREQLKAPSWLDARRWW